MTILCTIDLLTREVFLPADQRIAAYDHNVNVVHFQAEPVEDFSFDLSTIRIAAQGPNKARHDYAVDPSTVSIEEETGYITFDWPIPAGVTEMPLDVFKYGDKGNLIFAVCAEIISGSTLSKAWHSDDGIITVVAHLEPESGGGEDPEEEATNAQKIGQLQTDVAVINTQIGALANGSPTPAGTVAEMTEHDKVYLYTGSEPNYTAGNWYYYNGTAWTSGGTYGGAVTDTTLSISGAPADAKSVGDALQDLDDRITSIGFDTEYTQDIPLSWTHGTINTGSGSGNASNTRIYTPDFIPVVEGMTIAFGAGAKVSLRFYSSSVYSSYIGEETEWRTAQPVDVYQIASGYTNANYIRIVSAYTDNRDVSANADMETLGSLVSCYKACHIKDLEQRVIEIEKRTFDVSAKNNLLGNITIRAAKTINFSDGTPPHIDWYLIHDIDNNFYMTRDFVSKKFLFKFVPPIGSVANWSCGIDGNNNIFFLRDAAGYVDSEGPRLDDAKRTNPVYLLASEDYSTVHTLDFGTALKPAGWLENVGWCVLPNNDIILCEYTRGTLGTCNVWHVDGTDTTDASNWTYTWSHAIIDTTDTDAQGMKHCHCVQYDFYTGICYFGTGDSDTGSYIYHSLDNGLTWALTYGPNKLRCRQLNFVFTANKVYWASDSYTAEDHNFFIADRDSNGVIDVANATGIPLGQVNKQACYGCAYLADIGLVVMMDRNDGGSPSLILRAYDIDAGEIVTLGTVASTASDAHSGFRTKYVEWYPTGNSIKVGFNAKSGAVSPDTNTMAVLGNQGGTSGNGSDRINNLIMHVYKHGQTYGLRFDSEWC